MAKVIWEGWQKDASKAAQPTGPITLRDGRKILGPSLPDQQREGFMWSRHQMRMVRFNVRSGHISANCNYSF
jgi:hypothetical protein